MKKIGVSILASASALLPMIALAADDFGEINTFIEKISSFLGGTIIPIIFTFALVVFLWGVFQYFILGGGDTEKQEQGKQLMMYAIGGFVLMVSVWGIVNLISDGLGFSKDEKINNIPNVPTSNT